jgi:hypothetical protein
MLLGDVIEADDEYTGSHSRDVVDLVVSVADRLGLAPRDRTRAEFTALLHDVGKVKIPAEIINKAGRPDDAEWEIMKTHTVVGQELLERRRPPRRGRPDRALVPRALRRDGVSGSACGRGDTPCRTHRLRLRRLECDDDRPHVSGGDAAGSGRSGASRMLGDTLRSGRRRRADRRSRDVLRRGRT